MDRLFSSLRTDSQLVLLGDADQLPSVEAGAVFRDLCAALGAVRLTSNMRVARDPSARPIVAAAEAVNAGSGGAKLADMIAVRRSMDDVRFEGVEFLAAAWSDVGEAFLARWWRDRVATDEGLAARASRIYRLRGGVFEADDRGALRALFEHHTRSRLLCVTRVRGFPTSAETINDRLFVRMRSSASGGRGSPAAPEFALGMPVIVQRNDYERGLFNGDQGLIVRAETGDAADGGRTQKMAMFRRGESFEAVPLDVIPDLAPAYALTVHRAQGSEFDDVALLLPDRDLPLLTRELMYTAMTRARRSVLVVGDWDLFVRAVSRTVERHSGVGERLSRA
jgi:exodeoxyribonuclease V alpha subunit